MDGGETPAPIETLLEITAHFCGIWNAASATACWLRTSFRMHLRRSWLVPNKPPPPDEAIVPGFYRALRNAAVDQFRRRGAADRAYEAFAGELARQALKKRVTESCGTCAEHGCMNCTCKPVSR
jgi:hypothetical protein